MRCGGVSEADSVGVGPTVTWPFAHGIRGALEENLEGSRFVDGTLEEGPEQLYFVGGERATVGADIGPLMGDHQKIRLVDGAGEPSADESGPRREGSERGSGGVEGRTGIGEAGEREPVACDDEHTPTVRR